MFSRFLNWLVRGSASARTPGVSRSAKPRSATGQLFETKTPADGVKPQKPKPENDFNPYNTGKFDRSASWERISKSQR